MVNKMIIDLDVPIQVDDGIVLRADVYRPEVSGHAAGLFEGLHGLGNTRSRHGFPGDKFACVSTLGDVATRQANSTLFEPVKPETFTNVLSGQRNNLGAMAKLA
ncbi:hypothetical protein TSTA_058260 [Talaromyces stipitatus ATCC 10500]|uniref:Uncharacterized protein n=1 Tax=Talaromyces stipitatus (strain ATCC 10500 / CBS 375.48 / QM 6759 / NRRL 1006) TaxID=441959 RepID=B8MQD5_TALSN|nr:uncharacterized protein TSTA_058260 [Talaromyces stipitatus ATCC 10500]EED13337.1 hypothetical protein TSTA_058260 [Talaromyces stipitatus ATCC 10500]